MTEQDDTSYETDQTLKAELDAATTSTFADMSYKTIAAVAAWGASIGALSVVISLLLYGVIDSLLCQEMGVTAVCGQSGTVAFHTTTVLLGIVGLVGLIRLSVFRPLLVVVASAATLWGAHLWLADVHWAVALLWLAALYAVAYSLFAQVVRIQQFLLALLLLVVLVVGVRVALVM